MLRCIFNQQEIPNGQKKLNKGFFKKNNVEFIVWRNYLHNLLIYRRQWEGTTAIRTENPW